MPPVVPHPPKRPIRALLWITLLALLLLFPACGNPVTSQPSLPQGVTPGRILLWHDWSGEEAALLNEILAEFHAVYPTLQVIAEPFPEARLKSALLTAGGEGLSPDLVLAAAEWIPRLADQGFIRPVDPQGLADLGVTATALTPLTYDGQLYAAPLSLQTLALFANQGQIPAGTPPPATLDELLAQAEAGQGAGVHLGFDDGAWGVGAFGGQFVDATGALAVDDGGFARWLAWLDQAQTAPGVILSRDTGTLLPLFAQGELAYYVGHSTELPSLRMALGEALAVYPLPAGPGGPATPFYSAEPILFSRAASPQQAARADLLADFLLRPPQQRRLAVNAHRIPVLAESGLTPQLAPQVMGFLAQMESAHPLAPSAALFAGIEEGDRIYAQVLDGLLLPAEAAQALTATVNRDLCLGEGLVLPCVPSGVRFQHSWSRPTALSTAYRGYSLQSGTGLTILAEVWGILTHYGRRGAVQSQVGLFLAALFMAVAVDRMTRRRLSGVAGRSGLLARQMMAPLLLLGLLYAGQLLGQGQGWVTGLLGQMSLLAGAFLLYRLALALLYARDPAWARGHHWGFLAPLFGLGGLLWLLGLMIPLPLLAETVLLEVDPLALTVASLFFCTIGLYLWVRGTGLLQDLLHWAIRGWVTGHPGTAAGLLVMARYALIGLGIYLALASLGFDSATLAFFTGGLSVGIGFGSRELISNLISGLLLLFDQSVRPGDVVEVQGQMGRVQEVSIRATTLVTNDNVALVVPNQIFFTAAVTSYTRRDPLFRRMINVEVADAHSPHDVRAALMAAADQHPDVVKDPPPIVYYFGSGDTSYRYQLGIWVDDPMRANTIASQVYFNIFDQFQIWGIRPATPARTISMNQ